MELSGVKNEGKEMKNEGKAGGSTKCNDGHSFISRRIKNLSLFFR